MPDEEAITRWADIWLKEAEAQQEATRQARACPTDDALEMARWEANGKLHELENAMAGEVILLLRKAIQTRPDAVRELLRELFVNLIEEVLPGMVRVELAPVRKAYAEVLAELKAINGVKPVGQVQSLPIAVSVK